MLCKVNRYLDSYKLYFEIKEPDDLRHKKIINLSSGVSYIDIMGLYRELLSNEMILNAEFANYVPSCGSVLLRKVIAYYERWLAGVNDEANEYFNNVCINCGSTEIMAHIFEYLKVRNVDKILLVGLQYFVYEMLANHNNITSYLLISSEDSKTIPSIQEIQHVIEEKEFKHIFLTLPMNPSGEKYTHAEFVQLLKICKKNDCILFLDKCQWEEFEKTDMEYDYYFGEDIINTCSYQNVVIIDSFSKKRNIPGLRIGYVAGATDVINYIEYMNYITCCHHSVVAVAPIVIDCYYRMLCKEPNSDNKKKIQRDIRKIILTEANISFARYLLKYVKSSQCQEEAQRFVDEIEDNYSIYKENYDYACACLKKVGIIYTKRIGGFNFSLLYNNLYGYTEKEFKDYLQKNHSIFICTQEDFCDHTERKIDKFWIRITVGDEVEEFKRKFDKFMAAINNLSMDAKLHTRS